MPVKTPKFFQGAFEHQQPMLDSHADTHISLLDRFLRWLFHFFIPQLEA